LVERLLPAEEHARIHGFYRKNAADFARRLEAERQAARVLTGYRNALRGRMREVFDMVYDEALTQAEVASRLGIGRRAVSHYLVRAREVIALRVKGTSR
jgi:DNA-directed RNA polymerase specialized sigma subunit